MALLLLLSPGLMAQDFDPAQCPGKKVWKVAVVEGGSLIDFQQMFKQMTAFLAGEGLSAELESEPFDRPQHWAEMARRSKKYCVQFLQDGLYNAKWDGNERQRIKRELRDRIIKQGDIDVLWAMGTIAGIDYADPKLKIPVMVITASDPAAAGIIKQAPFSSKPNVHVQIEYERYASEIKLFYDIFKFERLGIAVDADPANQVAQAFFIAQEVADKYGFTLNPCFGQMNINDDKVNHQEFARCMRELAVNSDAVYIPVGRGEEANNLFSQIKPLIDKKIPTFSQTGASQVEQGVLMAMSDFDKKDAGEFEGRVMLRIMQGEVPDRINQYYRAPLSLIINLKTARMIEWKPPFEVLMGVDKVVNLIRGEH